MPETVTRECSECLTEFETHPAFESPEMPAVCPGCTEVPT